MPDDRSQFPRPRSQPEPAGNAGSSATPERTESIRERIHRRLRTAIVSRALPPGTKLTEEVIGGAFGASRSAVRWALARLQDEGLVALYPNRGAYVARPALSEARQIFGARRVIEAGLVRAVAARRRVQDLALLDACIAAELEAHRIGDLTTALRLSGEFHVILAEVVGNPVLTDILRGLVSRTVLALGVHQHRESPGCRTHEHSSFVDLLRNGDVEGAVAEMERHLLALESDLAATSPRDACVDLRAILAQEAC